MTAGRLAGNRLRAANDERWILLLGGCVAAAGTKNATVSQDDAVAMTGYPPPQPNRLEVDFPVDLKSVGLHAPAGLLRGDTFS